MQIMYTKNTLKKNGHLLKTNKIFTFRNVYEWLRLEALIIWVYYGSWVFN